MPKYKVKVPFFTSGRYMSRNSKVELTEEFADKAKRQLGEDSLVLIPSKQLKAEVKKNPKGAIKNRPTTKK